MSELINPLSKPAQAAHEIVLELIKAGKISYSKDAANAFSLMVDHYRAELKRLQKENEAQ